MVFQRRTLLLVISLVANLCLPPAWAVSTAATLSGIVRDAAKVPIGDVSAYVNNVTNELALLSFDRARGTLARIGYLTNQPRTFGISSRYDF